MSKPEEEAALLQDLVNDSVDHRGNPAVRSSTGGWRSACLIIGGKNKLLLITVCFLLLNLDEELYVCFRCGSWREICLCWDCMQYDHLPDRTARTINGERRRECEYVEWNRLDTSYYRSFRSRRLSWSLPDNSWIFPHLHTGWYLRLFFLPLVLQNSR